MIKKLKELFSKYNNVVPAPELPLGVCLGSRLTFDVLSIIITRGVIYRAVKNGETPYGSLFSVEIRDNLEVLSYGLVDLPAGFKRYTFYLEDELALEVDVDADGSPDRIILWNLADQFFPTEESWPDWLPFGDNNHWAIGYKTAVPPCSDSGIAEVEPGAFVRLEDCGVSQIHPREAEEQIRTLSGKFLEARTLEFATYERTLTVSEDNTSVTDYLLLMAVEDDHGKSVERWVGFELKPFAITVN